MKGRPVPPARPIVTVFWSGTDYIAVYVGEQLFGDGPIDTPFHICDLLEAAGAHVHEFDHLDQCSDPFRDEMPSTLTEAFRLPKMVQVDPEHDYCEPHPTETLGSLNGIEAAS